MSPRRIRRNTGPRWIPARSARTAHRSFPARAYGTAKRKIANVSRHKDLPVLRRYIRAATAFDDVGEVL